MITGSIFVKIYYFINVTPTHRDSLSEDDEARILRDEEKKLTLADLPTFIPKVLVLVCALFLLLLSVSPKTPGMGDDRGFVILAALALSLSMAQGSWFETLVYRGLALGGIWCVLLLVITGIILHIPSPDTVTPLGLPLGISAMATALVSTWVLISKRMLYPKLDFFFPATAILCLVAILSVI